MVCFNVVFDIISFALLSTHLDIDRDIYFRIVFNYVVDIFYHFTENDPRAIIGKPVFMTDLSVYFYMLM